MKFTKKNIAVLEPKGSKEYFVPDDAMENFGIFVYPSSLKKFGVKVRFGTSKKQKTIQDEWTDISIPDARVIAADYIKQYKKGIDVTKEEKKKVLKNKTLNDCIDEYLPTTKVTTQKDINKCKKAWRTWLNKPIRNITQDMILKAYDKRVKVSFHGARLEAAYLRSIWNHFKKALGLGESPTIILNEDRKGWSKKTTSHRRLDIETAIEWYSAIQILPVRDKNLFQLIYFTGLRAGEAMNLEWSSINFKNNTLHISDTKNGEPLNIPLNTQAIDVLLSIRDGEYKHKRYIFPQVSNKGDVSSMKYYSKSLTKLKEQGVMWSPHDSRRGFINAGGVTGCNSYMIKHLVNHISEESAHDGYNRYTIGELRPTTQTIGDYLENQLHPSNVVEFKKQGVMRSNHNSCLLGWALEENQKHPQDLSQE